MFLTIIVIGVIFLCVVFTYTNGFQDGSSVTAAGVASRAFSVRQAIALVAFFEFCGAMCGGAAVAGTIQAICKWQETPHLLPVLAAALTSAIVWNFATRRLGLPSSSTHALVGGLLGALVASGHQHEIVWGRFGLFGNLGQPTGVAKIIVTLIVSPLAGLVAGAILFQFMTLILLRATTRVNQKLRVVQWVATALLAFGHGSNDPPKSMAIMVLAMSAAGWIQPGTVPLYVHLLGALAIVAGVMSMAPSIVRRVGSGIYRLRTFHAMVTEMAAGIVITGGSMTGGLVSATQVISSSVMGVGSAARMKGVHWLAAKDILTAWFLTIPAAGLLAMVLYRVVFIWLHKLL